ncbi:MAG: hypothetical protein H3C57_00765 [Gammaproteobacteria bacterium]|nr:hypothetical protein [Gammaproteobacteria bacterium]
MILLIHREEATKYLVVIGYYVILSGAYALSGTRGLFNLGMYAFDFDFERWLVATTLVVLVAFALPSRASRVSDYFLWMHAAVPVVPTLVFFSFSGGTPGFAALVMTAFMLIRLSALFQPSPLIPGAIGTSPEWPMWIGIGAMYFFIIAGGDYSSIDFSLDKIYANRAQISESQSGYFEYLHTNLSKSLLPFLLILYYTKRRYWLLGVTVICSLGVFLVSQHRAALFFPLLALLCYRSTGWAGAAGGRGIMNMFSAVLIAGMVLICIDATVLLGDIAIRRTFIVPAALNYEYFRFFQEHPFTLFSDSTLSFGLVPRVYPDQVPFLIGYEIGLPGAHANASYLGSGFQQAGLAGVLLYVLILSIMLKFLDGIGKQIGNNCFVFAICAPSLFWLIDSSDLPSVFLTHGLLLSMAILWLWSPYLRLHLSRPESTTHKPITSPSTPPETA